MKDFILIFMIFVIVLLILKRVTSTFTSGTPANDPSVISQPIIDSKGNYQDIDPTAAPWTTSTNYVLDPGTPSWSQANINCWAKTGCNGIRHNFDTHQTWYLMTQISPTKTSSLSELTPTVQYNGADYSLPLAIVANKSTQDPRPPIDCVWSPTTSPCSSTTC